MKAFASLAAALSLAAAGSAVAGDTRIAYGDLDLTRASGASAFDARVEAAARRLCRDARRPGSHISDRAFCEAAVRREAVRGLPTQAQTDYARARINRVEL